MGAVPEGTAPPPAPFGVIVYNAPRISSGGSMDLHFDLKTLIETVGYVKTWRSLATLVCGEN